MDSKEREFSACLKRSLDELKVRVNNGFLSMFAIDGIPGTGKTTAAKQCCEYIQGRKIIYRMQLGVGFEEFILKLYDIVMHKDEFNRKKEIWPYIYDEASDLNKRAAMTENNRLAARVYDTIRTHNVIPILCLPSVFDFDKNFFKKGLIRFLVHLDRDPSKDYADFRIYDINQILYMKYLIEKKNIPENKVYNYVQTPFTGRIYDLNDKERKELASYSDAQKKDILKEARDKILGREK